MTVEKQDRLLRRLATIVKCFGDCPTGKTADVLRRQVQADKDLMRRLNEWRQKRDVAQLYKKAELYYQAKAYDKAREYFEQLIEEHPTSNYATKARQRLSKMPQSAVSGL